MHQISTQNSNEVLTVASTFPRNNPIPIRINAENVSPRKYIIIIIIYVIFISTITVFSFVMGVQSTIIKTNETELRQTGTKGCMNPNEFINNTLVCSKFSANHPKIGLIMRGVSPLNQFAIISLNQSGRLISIINNTEATVALYSLNFIKKKEAGKEYGMYLEGELVNQKKIRIQPSSYIGIYRNFSSHDYLLSIEFSKQLDYTQLNTLPILTAELINPKISLASIIFRASFFGIILITTIKFIMRYRQQPQYKRIFEQKFVIALSFSTLLFNNPFYALVVYDQSLSWTIVDFLLTVQSLCFWMVFIMYLNIRNKQCKNYGIKYQMPMKYKVRLGIFMFVFFLILAAFYIVFSVEQYEQDQFFIAAFTIAPGLAIPAIALFLLWMISVLFWLIQAWSEKQCLGPRSIESILTISIMLVLIRIFLNYLLDTVQNTPVLLTIFTYLLFNFNCLMVQYLFTSSQNRTASNSHHRTYQFVEIESGENDDTVDLGQISLVNQNSMLT